MSERPVKIRMIAPSPEFVRAYRRSMIAAAKDAQEWANRQRRRHG